MPDVLEQLTAALGGRYRVDRELGVGGMATVYLAQDLKHDRPVALKVLHPDLSVSLGAERFLREIRIIAQLQHPHVVGLIDSGEADGMLYYVMPYVAGESLRVRLSREGELPIGEAAWLLREIADALAYAHGKQIVHRDIKPENVLIAARHAQVADFGIARAVIESAVGSPITATGIAVGSPAYMAPEQASSDPHLDSRADIYAFGVMAYELITGVPPFTAPTAVQLVAAHLTREPESTRKHRPSTPVALDEIVLRCLAKRPSDRFQSADEIVARLDALLTGQLGTSMTTTREHQVAPLQFRISESLGRRLSRAVFDPRMLSDTMEYLDNHARSGVLVCFIPAVGLDAAEYEEHLRSLPYRCVAMTLYGFEPARKRRPAIPLADHQIMLRELLRHLSDRIKPEQLIVCGFSSGGDIAMRLNAERSRVRVDGILSLGCNLSLDTCFLSRVLARFKGNDRQSMFEGLRTVAETARSVDEWLTLHTYLVSMLAKFQNQIDPLRTVARDIVAPFEHGGEDVFVEWYRQASANVRALRCVFEDDTTHATLLRDIQLRNLESGILGDHYREDSLVIEPETNHFNLVEPGMVARQLDALVAAVREAAPTTA
jgi:pimeloyl-ACP methyl ester carboxylesterase